MNYPPSEPLLEHFQSDLSVREAVLMETNVSMTNQSPPDTVIFFQDFTFDMTWDIRTPGFPVGC